MCQHFTHIYLPTHTYTQIHCCPFTQLLVTANHFVLCVRKRYACMSAVDPLSKITVFVCCLYVVQQGEIWPNITAQFVIVFKPEEAKLYQQTIYCDVTGQCQYKTIPHISPISTLHATDMALGRSTSDWGFQIEHSRLQYLNGNDVRGCHL